MAKYVSADTITEITTSAGFLQPNQSVRRIPTVEELIDDIRAGLSAELKSARARERGLKRDPNDPQVPRSVQLSQQQQDFERVLTSVPEGFKLTPVLYSRITTAENAKIKEEYSFRVRPAFLRFCAEHHADELKKLGICDGGIERMRNGLDPANEKGELYQINIDHILERAGSGQYGKTKASDPDNATAPPAYLPNHFGNLMLIPEQVHEFKNLLNQIQDAAETRPGDAKWILMMTPVRNEEFSGFVCPALPKTHPLAGVLIRPDDGFNRIEHNQYILGVTLNHMDRFKEMGDVRESVRGLIAKADGLGGTVADLADAEIAKEGKSAFRNAFNAAVAKDAVVKDYLDHFVRPALDDMRTQLDGIFEHTSQHLGTPRERAVFWEFAHFVRSPKMTDLRFDVEALPFEEATALHKTLESLVPKVQAVCDRLDAEAEAFRKKKFANDNRGAFNGAGRSPSAPPSQPMRAPRDDFGRRLRR